MANNINVRLGVVDDATTKLRRVKGEVTNFTKSTQNQFASMAKKMAAVFGAGLALRKVSQLASESIELAKVQIQAEQELTSALGEKNQALLDYASVLQSQTTYGDEVIIQAQATVAAFIKEEEQIKKLMPAILDLAAAKKMSLTSAADLVTKSVASSTNALSRYGINIEGAQGSTERIDSAVQALTEHFGGMAEALADTDVGKLQQMENTLGDMKEKIGKELIPLQVEWNSLILEAAEKFAGPISDVIHGMAYMVKGQEAINNKKLEEMKIIGQEIVELGKLKKEQEDIITLQEHRKAAGGWYDPEGLAQAKSNVALLIQEIRTLNEESQKINGLSPAKKTPNVSGTDTDTKTNSTDDKELSGAFKWLERQQGESFKAAQKEYEKRVELNKQLEAMAGEASLEAAKVQWEKRAQAEAVFEETRLAAIKDPIERELEMQRIKYDELTQMALGNKEAEDNINKARALDRMRVEELIAETQKDALKESLNQTVNNLQSMASQWKEFGALYKTFAISQTLIDTYKAAQSSYSALAGIPYVGPALGFAAAAVAVGAGIARVAQIKKQKFASGVNYAPGGYADVGELGPETMYVPRGAMIKNTRNSNTTNSQTINLTLVDQSGSITNRVTSEIRDGGADELVRMVTQRAARIGA